MFFRIKSVRSLKTPEESPSESSETPKQCEGCKKTFTSPITLKKHVRFCSKVPYNPANRRKLPRSRPGQMPFCGICYKTFRKESSVKKHQRFCPKALNQEKIPPCKYCNRQIHNKMHYRKCGMKHRVALKKIQLGQTSTNPNGNIGKGTSLEENGTNTKKTAPYQENYHQNLTTGTNQNKIDSSENNFEGNTKRKRLAQSGTNQVNTDFNQENLEHDLAQTSLSECGTNQNETDWSDNFENNTKGPNEAQTRTNTNKTVSNQKNLEQKQNKTDSNRENYEQNTKRAKLAHTGTSLAQTGTNPNKLYYKQKYLGHELDEKTHWEQSDESSNVTGTNPPDSTMCQDIKEQPSTSCVEEKCQVEFENGQVYTILISQSRVSSSEQTGTNSEETVTGWDEITVHQSTNPGITGEENFTIFEQTLEQTGDQDIQILEQNFKILEQTNLGESEKQTEQNDLNETVCVSEDILPKKRPTEQTGTNLDETVCVPEVKIPKKRGRKPKNKNKQIEDANNGLNVEQIGSSLNLEQIYIISEHQLNEWDEISVYQSTNPEITEEQNFTIFEQSMEQTEEQNMITLEQTNLDQSGKLGADLDETVGAPELRIPKKRGRKPKNKNKQITSQNNLNGMNEEIDREHTCTNSEERLNEWGDLTVYQSTNPIIEGQNFNIFEQNLEQTGVQNINTLEQNLKMVDQTNGEHSEKQTTKEQNAPEVKVPKKRGRKPKNKNKPIEDGNNLNGMNLEQIGSSFEQNCTNSEERLSEWEELTLHQSTNPKITGEQNLIFEHSVEQTEEQIMRTMEQNLKILQQNLKILEQTKESGKQTEQNGTNFNEPAGAPELRTPKKRGRKPKNKNKQIDTNNANGMNFEQIGSSLEQTCTNSEKMLNEWAELTVHQNTDAEEYNFDIFEESLEETKVQNMKTQEQNLKILEQTNLEKSEKQTAMEQNGTNLNETVGTPEVRVPKKRGRKPKNKNKQINVENNFNGLNLEQNGSTQQNFELQFSKRAIIDDRSVEKSSVIGKKSGTISIKKQMRSAKILKIVKKRKKNKRITKIKHKKTVTVTNQDISEKTDNPSEVDGTNTN